MAAGLPSLDEKTFEKVCPVENDAILTNPAVTSPVVVETQPATSPVHPVVQTSPPVLQPSLEADLSSPDAHHPERESARPSGRPKPIHRPSNLGDPLSPDAQAADPDRDSTAYPDFGDDPPMEGQVNMPVRTKEEKERFNSDGRAAFPVEALRDPTSPDMVLADRQDEPQCEGMSELDFPPLVDDSKAGMGVLHDISGLIAKMPLDQAEDMPSPAPIYMPKKQNGDGTMSDYNPLARPTSRWRCRWRLFAPAEDANHQESMSGFLTRSHPRNDFRNPYIKALNNTREELDKSWSLIIAEETSATRLASARESALSSMQVMEVEGISAPDGLAILSCMPPEPCGERCRDGEFADFPVELCEISHSESGLNYKGCQSMMTVQSDMHRQGEGEDVFMTGFNPSAERV
jgi:hypothetical protein